MLSLDISYKWEFPSLTPKKKPLHQSIYNFGRTAYAKLRADCSFLTFPLFFKGKVTAVSSKLDTKSRDEEQHEGK